MSPKTNDRRSRLLLALLLEALLAAFIWLWVSRPVAPSALEPVGQGDVVPAQVADLSAWTVMKAPEAIPHTGLVKVMLERSSDNGLRNQVRDAYALAEPRLARGDQGFIQGFVAQDFHKAERRPVSLELFVRTVPSSAPAP